MRRKLPKTKEECFQILAEEEKEYAPEGGILGYHFTLGVWIRNNWIYGKERKVLELFNIDDFVIPDMASSMILEEYFEYKKTKKI